MNTLTYAGLTVTFLSIAISACSVSMRYIGGCLYLAIGPVFLYSIYQTYMHLLWSDEHYSSLCRLNLNPSYYAKGILENFDNVPKTFAEDA